MIAQKGPYWIEEAVAEGGYLEVNPKCEHSYHSVEAIHRLGTDYIHDRLVSTLTFGFWTYQYGTKKFAASGSTLLNVFPNRPFGTSKRTSSRNLFR